jgi:outer membrane protein OmpA-like peptidoglycan-associated protein
MLRKICSGALVLCLLGSAVAQAPAPMLRNSEVTESSLIDALAVDMPQSASGPTRGFKPAAPRAAGVPAAPPPKAAAGRANLLITFDTNSAVLTSESRAALEVVARAMQSDALAGLRFRVEGHADPRGDPKNNLELSQARAEAVVGTLVSVHGILPDRLQPVGKGSSEPLNKEQIDAPENRRVAIVTIRG